MTSTHPRMPSPTWTADRSPTVGAPALQARGLRVAYEERTVIDGLDVRIEPGTITTIIGPNGSGKSTLLKAFSRVLTPQSGEVLLSGVDLHTQNSKAVARQLAILPQKPLTPNATRVRDLVARGRFPHQSLFRSWTAADAAAVDAAMVATGVAEIADRDATALSGGQLQRAWIALILAQETPIVLLDEPTTFLDLAHQLEVLQLVRRINRERGATIVLVLHDLSLAARFSDRLIALAGGRIVADGTPWEVLTAEVLREAFGLNAAVVADPHTGTPWVVPHEIADPGDY